MAKPDTTHCWYRRGRNKAERLWRTGLFHKWGATPGAAEGDGCYTVAIIEDNSTHAVHMIEPDDIHFGTDPREDNN